MYVEGRVFKEGYYPQSMDADYIRILSFLEYGYDYNGDQSDYGIYIYVYNPSLKNFATSGYIQLAAGSSEDDLGIVRKYPIQEISRSVDYRFIKYKISDLSPGSSGKALHQLVSRDKRVYQVGGIELKMFGSNANLTDYEVSGMYEYTGFMKGCRQDPEAESTLMCEAEDLLTIELDLRSAVWRSETSSLGLGHQNEIASVYFAIDNEILHNYGYLYRVEGEFYENKIGSIVTDSEQLADLFDDFVGTKVEDLEGYDPEKNYSPNYPGIDSVDREDEFGKGVWVLGFNGLESDTISYKKVIPIVPYFYKVSQFASEGDIDITVNQHMNNIQKVGLYPLEPPVYRQYSIEMDDPDDRLNLLSYKSNHEWYDYFWKTGSFLWWSIPEDNYKDIAPIVEFNKDKLSLTDSELSGSLFIDEYYIKEFRDYTAEADRQDKTVHVLRFAMNQYYSHDMIAYDQLGGVQHNVKEEPCYYAEQTYYDDFDILRLTFLDEYTNRDFSFLVNSDPIDIVGGIENGLDYDSGESKEFLLPLLEKILGAVLVIALICGIFFVVDKIFTYINGVSIYSSINKALRGNIKSTVKKRRKRK